MDFNEDQLSKRRLIWGLVFLLGYSALMAVLNYLNASGSSTTSTEPASLWIIITGWILIVALYLPVYGIFLLSTRRWNWSLDDWGFGVKPVSWLAIGLAALALVFAWLFLSPIRLGELRLFDLGSAGNPWAHVSLSMLIFEGYARAAEELLYRGFALILFQRLLGRSGHGRLWAVVLSSALFALVHTHTPNQMLQLFLGAAIPLAVFTLWTRSISLALVLHGIAGGGPIGALFAAIFFAAVALYHLRMKRVRPTPFLQSVDRKGPGDG
jgi:membrane protease YdiL (CAAX protease family)